MTPLPIAQQWTLHSMQLVNWGCFDGHVALNFAGPQEVTLITGSTGSGKSTLLDAHIVLMHDPSTALNRASNATTQRSRSGDTRNVVSYMRGIHGQTRDVDGERDVMLREGTVWSAIAETWHSSGGGALTAVSMFFSTPNDGTRPSVRRDAWIADEFDLRLLEPFATGVHVTAPFPPRAMEKSYSGLQVMTSTSALHRTLWQRLGIGDEGAGKNALALLYKVQAADAVKSVNDLFTKFVLDKPCTYTAADEAEKHFAKLKDSWEKVRVIEDQTQRLSHIPGLWREYEAGREDVELFTRIGPTFDPEPTPFWKWRRDRECTALEEAEQGASRDYGQACRDHQSAAENAESLDQQWREIGAAIGANSALGELAGLEARIDAAESTRKIVEQDRQTLNAAVAPTLAVPDSRAGYDRQRTASSAFLATYSAAKKAADEKETDAKRMQWSLSDQLRDLREERSHFEGRRDVTDRDHDWIRNRYATLVGIPADHLPFAGELLDMLPEHEQWRMAAEKVLGATATSLLVPETALTEFRRVANHELTAYRIPYLIVRDVNATVTAAASATVAGRVQYREHPYAGWLSWRVAKTARHLCVDSPDLLGDLPNGYTEAVTVQGQTAHRDGGVVGGQSKHRHTIGFSPETILAQIDTQIDAVQNELRVADDVLRAAHAAVEALTARERAHAAFLAAVWDRIDAPGAAKQLDALQRRKSTLTDDPTAKSLLAQRDSIRGELKTANELVDKYAQKVDELDTARAALMERKDIAWDHLTTLEDVPDHGMERLDEFLAAFRDDPEVPGPTAADFEDGPWRRFVRSLNGRYQDADKRRDMARTYLTQTFGDYLRDYRDAAGIEDLTTDPDQSYWQFHAIHERHVTSGVEGAKADFTQYAAEYGGHELTTLSLAYQTERDEIEARLSEIRGALTDQPYGQTATGRVSIEALDGRAPADVAQFRKDLHAATSGATMVLSYEEAVAKFDVFDRLISQLTDPKRRDLLLDVRQHITLEAQHRDGGQLVSFHRELGTKSGGETQELTMFIIAAAIRYRVGTLDANTPRFAPVFMDEGLIKADPERTRRAVNVWTHLGFQPIIATTTDKHESISRTATVLLSVSKDYNNRSRIDGAVEVPDEPDAGTAEATA